MSDTPTSPASATPSPDPTPPALPPRRAHTFLARLAEAVRQQSWFAVALEVVIVIVGVVIGFQVTGWGQVRSDRLAEERYLRQLEIDFEQTLEDLDWVDRSMAERETASTRLLHAFQRPERPPRDSLLVWLDGMQGTISPSPVTRTIDALIATGDLRVLRNDSLRALLTEYAEFVDLREGFIARSSESFGRASHDVMEHVDPVEIHRVGVERGRWKGGSWQQVPDPFPDEGGRTVLPFDAQAFLGDEQAYRSTYDAFRSVHYVKMNRLDVRQRTEDMLRFVRSELEAQYGAGRWTERQTEP